MSRTDLSTVVASPDPPSLVGFPKEWDAHYDFHPVLVHNMVLSLQHGCWALTGLPTGWRVAAEFHTSQEAFPVVHLRYAVFDSTDQLRMSYNSHTRLDVSVTICVKVGDAWFCAEYEQGKLAHASKMVTPPEVDISLAGQSAFEIDDQCGLLHDADDSGEETLMEADPAPPADSDELPPVTSKGMAAASDNNNSSAIIASACAPPAIVIMYMKHATLPVTCLGQALSALTDLQTRGIIASSPEPVLADWHAYPLQPDQASEIVLAVHEVRSDRQPGQLITRVSIG